MSYIIESFGSTLLPTYGRANTDIGSGPSALQMVTLVDGSQYDALGSAQAPRAPTTITKTASIVEDTAAALDATYKAYLALRGTQANLWRRWSDGTREWRLARLDEVRKVRESHEIVHLADVQFVFVPLSRDWLSESESTLDYADLLAIDEDLATVGAEGDYAAYPVAVTINNPGSQTQPSITITVQAGSDGDVTGFTIKNVTTGHTLTFTGTIGSDGYLVIDCGAHSCMYHPFVGTPAGAYADLAVASTLVDWFVLAPGDNAIEISLADAGGGSVVTIEFYPSYG